MPKYNFPFEDIMFILQMFREDRAIVDGCVVCKTRAMKRWVCELRKDGLSRADVERCVNHVHISNCIDSLAPGTSGYKDADARKLADVYMALTRFDLEKDFPDRKFAFEVTEDEDDITVTYYQPANESAAAAPHDR